MKVVVLTSSRYGIASQSLPSLIKNDSCKVSMVILIGRGGKKYYKKSFRKMMEIGPLGALNGVRMRKWYNEDVRKLRKTEDIEDICKNNNIPFYITGKTNSQLTIDLFNEAKADLGLSLGNGYIGQKVFSLPKFGMINIHHEILPDYQNAQSVIWQIYNKSVSTGYTIHKIDKSIDTGEILLKKSVPISFERTLGKTVTKTMVNLNAASIKGLLEVIDNFKVLYENAKPQYKGNKYTTPSIWQFIRILNNHRILKKEKK